MPIVTNFLDPHRLIGVYGDALRLLDVLVGSTLPSRVCPGRAALFIAHIVVCEGGLRHLQFTFANAPLSVSKAPASTVWVASALLLMIGALLSICSEP